MFSLPLWLEEWWYGQRKSKLNIGVIGFDTIGEQTKRMIEKRMPLYEGDFIVTEKGYLRRGIDGDLNTVKHAVLDLSTWYNKAGLLGSAPHGNGRVRIIYKNGGIEYIVKEGKGLKIESNTLIINRAKLNRLNSIRKSALTLV